MRFASIACFLLAGCGGYQSVMPGMTGLEASKEMGGETTRIEPFAGGYSAVYYDNGTCVLFKDDRVVGKDAGITQTQAIALGRIGAATVTVCQPLCIPPGVALQRSCNTGGAVMAPRPR